MINLRDEIKNAIYEVSAEQEATAARSHNLINGQLAQIRGRPNFKNIEPHFDKALNNPKIMKAVASGRMTMTDLYDRLSDRYLMSGIKDVNRAPPVKEEKPQPQKDTRMQGVEAAKASHDVEGVVARLFPDDDEIFRR